MFIEEPKPEQIMLHSFYPSKGMYRPGETIEFSLGLTASHQVEAELELSIVKFTEVVFSSEQDVGLSPGQSRFCLKWEPDEDAYGGFGVELSVRTAGSSILKASTAVDIHDSWTEFPRYGFLMDFSPEREIPSFNWLKQFHINGLQFYDWQFRHDALLPDGDLYFDPFQREMSLETVRSLIAAAHESGMAAMPYLAVYAASLEFWRNHPEWALYGEEGESITFHDFLGYMDPSPGGSWAQHLLDQCARVDEMLDFDGFHVDQYGEPKRAWNAKGEEVMLPEAFKAFISALKQKGHGKPVVFNAVGNWPIEELAESEVDFVYIEIWPPHTRYQDLALIVQQAREISKGKPVVIALYIPADRPVNLRISEAVLFANGATHILLGENGLLLTDPYFPKSDPVPGETAGWLRNYWDFLVRYQGLLGPEADFFPADRYKVDSEQVMIFVRRRGNVEAVQLVNCSGIERPEWDQEHDAPEVLRDLTLVVEQPERIERVSAASPDWDNTGLVPLDWQVVNRKAVITLPECRYWASVFIHYSSMEQV